MSLELDSVVQQKKLVTMHNICLVLSAAFSLLAASVSKYSYSSHLLYLLCLRDSDTDSLPVPTFYILSLNAWVSFEIRQETPAVFPGMIKKLEEQMYYT